MAYLGNWRQKGMCWYVRHLCLVHTSAVPLHVWLENIIGGGGEKKGKNLSWFYLYVSRLYGQPTVSERWDVSIGLPSYYSFRPDSNSFLCWGEIPFLQFTYPLQPFLFFWRCFWGFEFLKSPTLRRKTWSSPTKTFITNLQNQLCRQ